MRQSTWCRRDVLVELLTGAMAVFAAGFRAPAATGAAVEASGAPRDREGRRRWALARMDEMAQERRRCRERFRRPSLVRECEADFERRYRAYNEVYLEAARD